MASSKLLKKWIAANKKNAAAIQSKIKKQAEENKYVAAICAAPKALAAAGLLEGKTATSYPGVLSALNLSNTNITEAAIEIDGKVITSRGPGTAMDFTLALIELLEGKSKRDEINQQLVR